jgi:hypothetical protein
MINAAIIISDKQRFLPSFRRRPEVKVLSDTGIMFLGHLTTLMLDISNKLKSLRLDIS